jgi:hypothetical protein
MPLDDGSNSERLTIAIDSAMGAWLLAIALDLFPSAFITRAGHSPALLHRASVQLLRLFGSFGAVVIGGRRCLIGTIDGVVLGGLIVATLCGRACGLNFNRLGNGRVHGGGARVTALEQGMGRAEAKRETEGQPLVGGESAARRGR